MRRNGSLWNRFLLVLGVIAAIALLGRWVYAKEKRRPVHLASDWSNRHMVYSQPSSILQGLKLKREPRFAHQSMRRNQQHEDQGDHSDRARGGRGGPKMSQEALRVDWGMSLITNGSNGAEMYPAKFSFDVSAAPDCTNDFVVYTIDLPASNAVQAKLTGTFSANTAVNGQTATLTNGANSLTLFANTGTPTTASGQVQVVPAGGPTAGDTVTVGAVTYTFVNSLVAATNDVIIGGSSANAAGNLEAAINNNSAQCATAIPCFGTGITAANPAASASIAGSTVTATAPTFGAANNFALTSSNNVRLAVTGTTLGVTTSGGGSNIAPNFLVGADSTATAFALSNAISLLGTSSGVGVDSTASSNIVTVFARVPGTAGNSITLAAAITGFAWDGINLSGGIGQAAIVGYNNLYSTQGSVGGLCNHDGPTVMWAYESGSGSALTSPVISGDGTKVAYVENPTGAAAILNIVQWKAGEGNFFNNTTAPTFPTNTLLSGQSWADGCPVGSSCIKSIPFQGGATAQDTNSAPFYDFNTDTLYVGDNIGRIHKFTGVFLGIPAEVTTAPWPLLVNSGAILSSPVFDGVSGNLFVGDNSGRLSFIKEVGSTVGTCDAGSNGGVVPCLGNSTVQVGTGGAIVDAPIVDGTNSSVFAFNGTDTTRNGTLIQTNTSLTGSPSGAANVTLNIGGTGAGSYLHAGTFDNTYFLSAQGSTAGHLYVCGKDPGNLDRPAIFQLSFAANGDLSSTLGTPLIHLASNDGEACSPITEIQNPNAAGGAKEWIFFSIGNRANNAASNNPIPAGPCRTNNAGCIVSIDITGLSSSWTPFASGNGPVTNAVAVPAGPATGPNGGNIDSTSGIIVDNIGADPTAALQVSSIYFALTGNSTGSGPGLPSCNTTSGVGCAIKLTQAGLQ